MDVLHALTLGDVQAGGWRHSHHLGRREFVAEPPRRGFAVDYDARVACFGGGGRAGRGGRSA